MKKFLVPTDFSDTSKNAAQYAVKMLAGKPDVRIILYYVYDKPAGSDGSPLTEDESDRQLILGEALSQMKLELAGGDSLQIDAVAEYGSSLIDNIERYVRHQGIDMVIMGITGATKIEQIFMGSNTLKLIKEGVCPVMIIPPDAKYEEIKNVALTSDFKDVDTSIPVSPIQNLLKLFNPTLYIINVDSEHYVEITEEYKSERAKLEKYFRAFNPQFAFIRLFDFLEAINNFTRDQDIDIIVTVPRRHSFLSNLFKTSHTKKLAYHSNVPIIAIHE
ncbi:MAG: universal stress protein [Chitinophagaceae bacterium]|nr:universal stress protein [Chitinophagaceae bacterium]